MSTPMPLGGPGLPAGGGPSDGSRSPPVVVTPFHHQVGGHTAVVRVPGSACVAKPMDPRGREHAFYRHLPKALVGFVPQFHGVRTAQFSQAAAHKMERQVASASGASCDESGSCENADAGPALDTLQHVCGGQWYKEEHRHVDEQQGSDKPIRKSTCVGGGFCRCSDGRVNSWSLRMYKKALDKTAASSGAAEFILLENLTARFRHPCVMDIKIGKRSYADDASPKKRARSEAKSLATTSHSLGFRICGMQVYSAVTGAYLCHDKYYGRELTPDTVPKALEQFFSLNTGSPPSKCPRSRAVVMGILHRLTQLQSALSDVSGLRFYSSSVLLVYEGDVTARALSSPPLSDSAGSLPPSPRPRPTAGGGAAAAAAASAPTPTHPPASSSSPPSPTFPDRSAPVPSGSLPRVADDGVCESDLKQPESIPPPPPPAAAAAAAAAAAVESSPSPSSLPAASKSVDVRIIDFANTTRGLDGQAEGPDEAFIEGLASLERMLRQLVDGSPATPEASGKPFACNGAA